jgi:hypothetical protein
MRVDSYPHHRQRLLPPPDLFKRLEKDRRTVRIGPPIIGFDVYPITGIIEEGKRRPVEWA